MTRLFIRFFLGVLFILFCAWSIHTFLFRQRSEAANVQVIEDALGGGVRIARETMIKAPDAERAAALAHVQRRFDYPVQLIGEERLPPYVRRRFAQGDQAVLIGKDDAGYMLAPLDDSRQVLVFGPLPKFAGPSQTEIMTGLGLVLLLAAAAIALLLRPVVRQLRLIERTALAIADGDFSARVDERRVRSASTLAKAFNNMAGRTETMLRTQRELLQAVSHELRTPLARIHFAIDLIRDAEDEEQREERLEALESASQELDELVGELLRYVRLESGEPHFTLEEVELLPVLEDLIEKHSMSCGEIAFEIDPQLREDPVTVQADPVGLHRALGNLLQNAGRLAKSQVFVGARRLPEGLVIEVDDDGPGIAEEDRERVFEPFVRLDDSGRESRRGAGLGLALVRRIVDGHGGSISAQPSPLGGCRMQSLWPLPSPNVEIASDTEPATTDGNRE